MGKIMKVLDDHELKYLYDEDEPKHIKLGFDMDNKPFNIRIILQNGKVILKLIFPFRVQTNAYPFMCMFMAEFNENKAFSLLNIDPDDGELTMKYTHMLDDPSKFDEKYFFVYMVSLIHPALEIYTKAVQLAVGMVPGKDRKLYKKLLEMALKTIDGDFDDDNVGYGTESVRLKYHPYFPTLLGNEDGGDDREDPESDDEDITRNLIHSLMRREGMPNFEEFARMREITEEDGEVKSKDKIEKSASMLSMFAKRDEDKESKTVGGNEDE